MMAMDLSMSSAMLQWADFLVPVQSGATLPWLHCRWGTSPPFHWGSRVCLALLNGISVDNWSRSLKQPYEFGVAFLASAINIRRIDFR